MESVGGISYSPIIDPPTWYLDPNDTTKLFQDTGKTTAADTDDDPVAVLVEKTGTSSDFVRLTDDTHRATLKVAIQNGKNVLRYNGTTSVLRNSTGFPQPCHVFAVVRANGWTSADYFFGGGSSTAFALYQSALSPRAYVSSGTASTQYADLTIGTFFVAHCYFNGASSTFKVNNTLIEAGNFGTQGIVNGLALGARYAGSLNGNVDLGTMFLFNSLRADETKIVNYLMDLYNVPT